MAAFQDPPAGGLWEQNALHLVPRGEVTWIRGTLGWSGVIAGKPVASLRKSGGVWLARVPGWQWCVTDGMGVARLNQVPGEKIQMTPVKAFDKVRSAKTEIRRILSPSANTKSLSHAKVSSTDIIKEKTK